MGRENPMGNRIPNPAERFFEWDGSEGNVYWYDKEKKERVVEPRPFMFLFLAQLYQVTGYNEKNEVGIYSNEVADTQNQRLIVNFNDGEEIARGLYSSIKEKVNYKGGKFTASVYIVYMDEINEPHIGNLKLKGASISQWFDFLKDAGDELTKKGVLIHSFGEATKGNVTYRYPLFKLHDIKESSVSIADRKYEEISEYLEWKGSQQAPETAPESSDQTRQQGQAHQRHDANPYSPPQGSTGQDPRPQPPQETSMDGWDDIDDDLPF